MYVDEWGCKCVIKWFLVCVCLERNEFRERMMEWKSEKTWNKEESQQNESRNRDEVEIKKVNDSICSIHSFPTLIIDSLIH